MDRTNIEDAKIPSITFALPRGYLLNDGDGGVHVLCTATVREMCGEEEDIIANDKVSFTKRLHQLVGSCLTTLEDGDGHSITDRKQLAIIASKMLMSDLLVCVIRIREVTIGNEIRQVVSCPNCVDDEGNPYSWTAILDLSEFEALPVKGDAAMSVREYTTSRGTVVTWEMMTGDAELIHERKKLSKDKATASLLTRVRTLNGEVATKVNLKALSYVERNEIRKQFDAEGGVETDFDAVCRNCDHEFKVPLEVGGMRFFNPSEASSD
jgi:hypothetical protein